MNVYDEPMSCIKHQSNLATGCWPFNYSGKGLKSEVGWTMKDKIIPINNYVISDNISSILSLPIIYDNRKHLLQLSTTPTCDEFMYILVIKAIFLENCTKPWTSLKCLWLNNILEGSDYKPSIMLRHHGKICTKF